MTAQALRDRTAYVSVTAAYWAFTLTDGALRMLVLLHFHRIGFSPLDLAYLFLLYEAMGIVTNLAGGWIGARFGLRVTLFAGLAVQIAALAMLSATQPHWAVALSVAYVMAAQALSGVAKDLTKMSSKSAVKLVVAADDQSGLFKWVALLTGSKNALKGIGFLLGAVLLQHLGFEWALWSMALALAVILAVLARTLVSDLGQAKSKPKSRELFSKSREINYLSAARIFLFASRDVWFVVAVPIYFYATLGWSFDQVGSFMAAWVVGYGVIQAVVPKLLRGLDGVTAGARAAKLWGALLAGVPVLIVLAMEQLAVPMVLVGGLLVFGAVFAINSAVHSYLILGYASTDKVALDVGFYYGANATGRLLGTLLSGLVFQLAGLQATLWVSVAMVALAVILTWPLAPPKAR